VIADDTCWFCNRAMTRSHVLLHRPNERLVAGREEAWEGKKPGGVRGRFGGGGRTNTTKR